MAESNADRLASVFGEAEPKPDIVYPPPPFSGAAKRVVLQPMQPKESKERRPPGRPKTTVRPDDVRTGGQRVTPTARAEKVEPRPESESERKARLRTAYNKQVDDLQKKIVGEFNDQLLQALMVVGVPAGFLYKEGAIPKKVAPDSIYTPLGESLTLNAFQADWIAHGIVELEKLPWLKNLNLTYDPDKPSYFWVGMGGLGAVSYVAGLLTAVGQLRKMINELKQLQQMQTVGAAGPEYNGPAFSEQGPY